MMQDDMLLCAHGLGENPVDTDPEAWALHDPTVDLDGDGFLDTRAYADGDAALVASDLDGDGAADHVTSVESDGEYSAWQAHRQPDGSLRWERTDHGRL